MKSTILEWNGSRMKLNSFLKSSTEQKKNPKKRGIKQSDTRDGRNNLFFYYDEIFKIAKELLDAFESKYLISAVDVKRFSPEKKVNNISFGVRAIRKKKILLNYMQKHEKQDPLGHR